MCIDSHEQILKKAGATAEAIQTAVRIGAVMKAVATVHAALH
jgi:alkyl hydroperoxide reductase subunit D